VDSCFEDTHCYGLAQIHRLQYGPKPVSRRLLLRAVPSRYLASAGYRSQTGHSHNGVKRPVFNARGGAELRSYKHGRPATLREDPIFLSSMLPLVR
jgi:hypothetical protein